MVATPIRHQHLSVREDPGAGHNAGWGAIQIATPVIVGGALLLLFALVTFRMIWRSKPNDKPSYSYQQVRADWSNKMGRVFVPRWKRVRVRHSSVPMTIDDSMRASGPTAGSNHWSRQYRSGSSDSQTPLTSACYTFDYPPNNPPESPPTPPPSKRRPVRWWWFLGSRPQQVKSGEPGNRWQVDGPDGSSSGHGHSVHGHAHPAVMAPLPEEQENVDEVIPIGQDFASIAPTPMTRHFPEQANLVRGLSVAPEHPPSPRARTPIPIVSYSPSHPGTPVSLASRDLPPSYTRYPSPSSEDIARMGQYGSYMTIAASGRSAGHTSPRPSHGRELSSDSFLATQAPMAVASTY